MAGVNPENLSLPQLCRGTVDGAVLAREISDLTGLWVRRITGWLLCALERVQVATRAGAVAIRGHWRLVDVIVCAGPPPLALITFPDPPTPFSFLLLRLVDEFPCSSRQEKAKKRRKKTY